MSGIAHGVLWVLGIGLAVPIYLFLCVFLPLLAHESGHLLAAYCVGFKPTEFRVSMLVWRNGGDRWRLHTMRHPWWFSGWVMVVSRRGSVWERRRMMILILAGPFASILFYFFLFSVPIGLRQYSEVRELISNHRLLPYLFSPLYGFAMMTFVNSLMPTRMEPMRSDGSTAIILLRGGAAAERYKAVMTLKSILERDVEWSCLPEPVVNLAIALPDSSLDDAFGCYYAYFYYLGRQDYRFAGAILKRARDSVGKLASSDRAEIYLESAFHTAFYDGDTMAARQFYEKSKGAPSGDSLKRARVEAAMFWAEGDIAACRERAKVGKKIIKDRKRVGATYPAHEARYLTYILRFAVTSVRHKP